MIRPARPDDAEIIRAIWNRHIRETTATFHAVEKTPEEVRDRIATAPVFVAEGAGQVVGFAHYGQFRAGDGYRHTAEHTLYVDPASKGHGLGRALLSAVEDHARVARFHSLWAAISAENESGIGFHAACGFTQVATLPEAGRKFDRWIDLVLMQKRL
ncbi:GNAT family N-acetyltransferase [Histidinibacterium aquaticum]|uniref:N-acetyltransferase family protein n=1 Tax=Histidinibacterium aquaticum TaxID=2613962 RepID=A0A5J5GPD3_9RHOB|nr:GNAT family N-acetyltransferase [Histidinibacterium aquaticum]KAA9009915.1 N-acetyltransferase family protein [Histidinibacterium aquaticum]